MTKLWGMSKRIGNAWSNGFAVTPPLLWLPFFVGLLLFSVLWLAFCIAGWLIGFYSCAYCEKGVRHRSFNKLGHYRVHKRNGEVKVHTMCVECLAEREVKERKRKERPAPPPGMFTKKSGPITGTMGE